jgi:hypothetical protein
MSTPASPAPDVVAQLRAFLAEHPEAVQALAAAAEDVAEHALPPSMYDVVHSVVGLLRGIDETAREEFHAAIDRHQAEHDALVKTVGVDAGAEPEPAAAVPSDPELPAAPSSPPAPAGPLQAG